MPSGCGDVKTGQAQITINANAEKVLAIAALADGNLLACGFPDETVRLWDLPGQ
jgi:hypothetical protein